MKMKIMASFMTTYYHININLLILKWKFVLQIHPLIKTKMVEQLLVVIGTRKVRIKTFPILSMLKLMVKMV